MEPFGNYRSNKCKHQPAAELPQWNARFRFTAQKGISAAADDSKDALDAAKARQTMLASQHCSLLRALVSGLLLSMSI
jgi:hypothetical protein